MSRASILLVSFTAAVTIAAAPLGCRGRSPNDPAPAEGEAEGEGETDGEGEGEGGEGDAEGEGEEGEGEEGEGEAEGEGEGDAEGEGEGEGDPPDEADAVLPAAFLEGVSAFIDECEPSFLAASRLNGADEWVVRTLTQPPATIGMGAEYVKKLNDLLALSGTGVDPAGIIACEQAIDVARCANLSEVLVLCEKAIAPLLPGFVPCVVSQQCNSGYCSGAAKAQCGICSGASAACTNDAHCAVGQRCNDSAFFSSQWACDTPVGLDENCASSKCDYGLICRSTDFRCAAPMVESGPCGTNDDCLPTLFCDNQDRCRAPVPAPAGESCFSGGGCEAGLICSGSTCVHIGQIGEACDTFDFSRWCAMGLSCTDGSCQPTYTAEGGPCDDATVCTGGSECLGGRCRVPLPPGASCDFDDFCADGNGCYDGSCRRPGSGESCVSIQCEAGTFCSDGRCQPVALGDPCDDAFDCGGLGTCVGFDDPQAICFAVPEGESCVGLEGFCEPGFSCDAQGICSPPGDLGEACVNLGCRPGLFCEDGVCEALRELGEPCTTVFQSCVETAACDGNICVAPAAGEACVASGCPAALACVYPELICKDIASRGEPCTSEGTHCLHGDECVDGVCGLALRGDRLGDPCTPSFPESCGDVLFTGLVCAASGQCIRPEVVSDDCDELRLCRNAATTTYCASDGSCAQRPLPTQACSETLPCNPLEAVCIDGLCRALAEPGESCSFEVPCRSTVHFCDALGTCRSIETLPNCGG